MVSKPEKWYGNQHRLSISAIHLESKGNSEKVWAADVSQGSLLSFLCANCLMNINKTSFFTAGNIVPFTMHALLLMQPFRCNGKVSVFVQDFLTDFFYQGGSACIQPSLANSFVTSVWFPPFYPVLKSSLRRSRGQSRFHKSIFHLAIQSWIRNMVVSQQRKSRLYLSPTGIIFSKKKWVKLLSKDLEIQATFHQVSHFPLIIQWTCA